ncbi:hypothetical protein GGS26DRAFT_582239 [Hypomontagnella submonticulosa]|nr:hypothetical protein GGS26DRAFT_582239 [Hypomontagnella submonticulosa]
MLGSSSKGAVPRLQCSTCDKTYSNISHLRRHEATHDNRRSIVCPSCSKSFNRIDVARRHLQSCVSEDNGVTLQTAKRGKKPKACDICSRSKVPCDLGAPCSRCRARGLSCSYLRVGASATSSKSEDRPTKNQIPWLLGFTNPLASGADEAVARDINSNDSSPEDAMPVPSTGDPDRLEPIFADEYPAPYSGLWFPGFDSDGLMDFDEEQISVANALMPQSPALDARMDELVAQLAEIHRGMRLNGATAEADFDLALARSVFTTQNLEYFVWVYFQRIHPYHPIIHPRSFSAERSSLPIVLAVFLMGALYCAPLDTAMSARHFFHVAEVFIFEHPNMQRILASTDNTIPIADTHEILQAALSIISIHNSKNDERVRRRIRIHRVPCFIAAVRLSGALKAKHQLPLSEYTTSTWYQFIEEETSIRIGHWAQLCSNLLSGFFKIHPQIYVREMVGDMPCRSKIFEADTPEKFAEALTTEPSGPAPPSLSHSISFLLEDSWPGPEDEAYRHVTPEILLIMLSALGTTLAVLRGNCLFPTASQALLRACMRWRELWDKVTAENCERSAQGTGYAKHALEMWWFSMAVIKAEQAGDATSRYLNDFALDSFAAVNEFLDQYKGVDLS